MKNKVWLFGLLLLLLFSAGCSNNQKATSEVDNSYSIESLSLDEKIGQMLIVGFDDTTPNEHITEMIEKYYVGGVILFKRNVENSEQLLTLNNNLKSINRTHLNVPLFISVDEEGGLVSRLPDGATEFPSNKVIGEKDNEELSYQVGSVLGKEVKAYGFNLNFAPVLDIHSNPENTVIGSRSFGDNAEVVSKLGIATMKGLQSENVVPAIKHFPGHGDTKVDSHIGLPVVEHGMDRLKNLELIPFKKAIQDGADMTMISHIMFPAIDNSGYPATMSEEIITNLLRKELGFNGVVITDDMEMGAITENYGLEEAVVQTIKAGADILLMAHDKEKQIQTINFIKKAVENGEISEERINESVQRILKLKEKYGINDNEVNADELNVVGSKEHLDISKQVQE